MRVLLDTHVALWAITDDARLPTRAREVIVDTANDVIISAASIWEIAIKHALARGLPTDMPVGAPEAVRYFRASGFTLLALTADHASAVAALPRIHRDPFDRMLVAQALHEPLRLITHDDVLARYGDTVMLV
ncbi:MAG: type II toxin-antitoxin system VapC family toxin [Alphaproteobacteria bacterium]|nr:type II toxin-antitoxin system VapC family toxin [Alphaproteobacteria bacterium]